MQSSIWEEDKEKRKEEERKKRERHWFRRMGGADGRDQEMSRREKTREGSSGLCRKSGASLFRWSKGRFGIF